MEENNEELVKIENSEKPENLEPIETINTVKISNDAVATYAGIAISEVPGVYGMSGTLAGITEAISGKKSYTKGVKVDINEKTAKIDVSIIVEYGARIPDVAFEIQTKVKKSVETMTGLKVSEVNVNVQGVHAITEKEEEKPTEEEA
jgi:uncharacterized alkaline shock family protein YloU